jgi:hypothetical protein
MPITIPNPSNLEILKYCTTIVNPVESVLPVIFTVSVSVSLPSATVIPTERFVKVSVEAARNVEKLEVVWALWMWVVVVVWVEGMEVKVRVPVAMEARRQVVVGGRRRRRRREGNSSM